MLYGMVHTRSIYPYETCTPVCDTVNRLPFILFSFLLFILRFDRSFVGWFFCIQQIFMIFMHLFASIESVILYVRGVVIFIFCSRWNYRFVNETNSHIRNRLGIAMKSQFCSPIFSACAFIMDLARTEKCIERAIMIHIDQQINSTQHKISYGLP